MESQMIKFLLSNGANPHIEDKNGLDCCDKGRLIRRYEKIRIFQRHECKANTELRQKYNAAKQKKIIKAGTKLESAFAVAAPKENLDTKNAETEAQIDLICTRSIFTQTDEVADSAPTIQVRNFSDNDSVSIKKSMSSCENDQTITFRTPTSDAVRLHKS